MKTSKLEIDIKAKTEIYNIGTVNSTLYGRDKIRNIKALVEKVNKDYQSIRNNFENSLTIDYLKSQCLLIEEFILEGITYAKSTALEEKKIRVLIWNIKKALSIQKEFEKRLIDLNKERDYDNENEMFAAFDFELYSDKPNTRNYLPNALEVEKRIIRETGFEKEKPLSTYTKELVKKSGRNKAQIKEAKAYLKNFFSEEQKLRFLSELKEQYQNSTHKIFNLVIKVLIDKEYLQMAERNALKISFEKALERRAQAQQNFNIQFNQESKSTIEYKSISENIQSLFEKSLTN
ncbi:hypothetical protein V8G69_07145 [Gaetbulibacter sp. M235]|uniref:hypothetical protein n=1 Tax=Gaetbulibacter sp. M235 TaxID=3126510 RepID=UPI00374F850B